MYCIYIHLHGAGRRRPCHGTLGCSSSGRVACTPDTKSCSCSYNFCVFFYHFRLCTPDTKYPCPPSHNVADT